MEIATSLLSLLMDEQIHKEVKILEAVCDEVIGHEAQVLQVGDVAQEDAIVLEVFHIREALQVECKDV